MTMIQPSLPFKVKKSLQFYSKKEENEKRIEIDAADLMKTFPKERSLYSTEKINLKRPIQQTEANVYSPAKKPKTQLPVEVKSPKQNDVKIVKLNAAFQHASTALHGSKVSRMPAREKELEILEDFLVSHFINEKSGSLYISGPPGTGKTASLTYLLEDPKFKTAKYVYVNCASLRSANSIYQKICQGLKLKIKSKTGKGYLQTIEENLARKHKMILLVLDEIDQLDSKKQSILYTIFDWPSRTHSKIALIGIANALDLTDRMLPRLQKKLKLRPKLLHFPPYTKEQIVHILTSRLSAGASNVFSPVALQLLAAKVAALSGDVRRALDLARLVIEATTRNSTDDVESVVNNKNTTVEVKQVLQVLDNVYGGGVQRLENDIVEAFPLQQKLLICSLLLILTNRKTKDVTVGQLYEVYSRVCKKRNITVVDSVEFPSVCELVQIRGIVKLSGKKEPRMHKVSLQWDENEVHNALKDKKLIADILSDISCLSR